MQTTSRAQTTFSEAAPILHLGMVSDPDGILFAAVEPSAEALRDRVAAFVQERAATTLWANDAVEIEALLESGRSEEAIDFYFSRVGERWDREFLHREHVYVMDRDQVRQPGFPWPGTPLERPGR